VAVNKSAQAVVIVITATMAGPKVSGLSRLGVFPGICTAGTRHKSMGILIATGAPQVRLEGREVAPEVVDMSRFLYDPGGRISSATCD
jgi:hypothetical protein